MTVGLLALVLLVWAICGNGAAHAKEGSAPKVAKKAPGIAELLLVRGKSRSEALQLALGSGAKKVIVALWESHLIATAVDPDAETTTPVLPDPVGIIEYHIVKNGIVETELRIPLSKANARKSIKSVYDKVTAAGKINPKKTDKHKVFLTIPLADKRVLNVEMQKPASASSFPWFVRFRPAGSGAGADSGDFKVIADVRIPVSVSSVEQLKAFLKPQWELVQRIELLDTPISFGPNGVVRSERLTYGIAAGDDTKDNTENEIIKWGVGPGILGQVECRIPEKGTKRTNIAAFAYDIRQRIRPKNVVLSQKDIFIADVTMSAGSVKGRISAVSAILDPKLREEISGLQPDYQHILSPKLSIYIGPRHRYADAPTTQPAE
jgi:hypothetical protein